MITSDVRPCSPETFYEQKAQPKQPLKRFRDHLVVTGKSPHTITFYTLDVRLSSEWFAQTNGCELTPERITPIGVGEFGDIEDDYRVPLADVGVVILRRQGLCETGDAANELRSLLRLLSRWRGRRKC